MSRTFFDTNVIAYANDRRAPEKQTAARSELDKAIRAQSAVISTQVMKEFVSVALTKLDLSIGEIRQELQILERGLQVVQLTPALIELGLDIHHRYQINFWDGLIIAAATEAGCDTVLSEDLNDGQRYEGVQVKNPFQNASA